MLPAPPRVRRGCPGRAQRGTTFLEVVFATALVGVLAATLVGLFSFINATQRREQRYLAAAEVANRLMLNYLDNPAAMPDPGKVIEYGPPENPAKFRWSYTEQPVRMNEARPEARDETRAGPLKRDRMKLVTVRVWLSEYSGGEMSHGDTVPGIVLTRLIDPLALRNPDSTTNMLKDPAAYQRWLEAMMGFTQGQVVGGAGGAGGAATGAATVPPGTTGMRAGSGARGARDSGRLGARDAFKRAKSATDHPPNWAYEQWGGPGAGGRGPGSMNIR
jgi:type II secretory pathway pseudopilin PulG